MDDEIKAIADTIRHLGFYDDDGIRVELEMPMPGPLAKHWHQRGMRLHPELAVVKPSRNERGEQVWVPLDAPDPEPAPPGDPEQLAELKGVLSELMARVEQALAQPPENADPRGSTGAGT